MRMTTAVRAGYVSCHACGLLFRLPGHLHGLVCSRCGADLHLRKPDSVTRTWALVIAAYVLIVPANVLPVMISGSLFGAQSDTIMSGVVYLWNDGSWHLAVILFIASIAVPFAKLFAMTYLLLSVQWRSTLAPEQRTRLYRVLEFVGRWSMIDIYVAAILAALVQFGGLMSIQAGPGAIAFGAVVVVTMFAAESFDPRLIWDPVEDTHGR
jgi:paraquat-inducible protein A